MGAELLNADCQSSLPETVDAGSAGLPRRVVFVEESSEMGGVEWSTLYLVKHLNKAAWKSLVVCPGGGSLPEACRAAGIDVEILPRRHLVSTSLRIGKSFRLPNPLACAWDLGLTLTAARSLSKYLAGIRADLVVTKGMFAHFYGGLAARWAGVPCLWHAQDFISERSFGLLRWFFGRMARLFADRVVADGASIARQLPASMQERVRVIHNGVDTDRFRRDKEEGVSARTEFGIGPDLQVIGHVARLTPWKGQHHLIEAMAKIVPVCPKAHLLLVGSALFDSDTYENKLRGMVQSLGLEHNVTFAGYRKDVARLLSAMDVFVYPSVEKDTAPLSLLSALAAGLPIVAFDIEGVREVLPEPGQALLVPVGDANQLAAAVTRVLQDPKLRQDLAVAARRRAEEAFDLDLHVNHFEEVFADMVGVRP
jgi:glycosyltransferase involved in cell wall biosynthesis